MRRREVMHSGCRWMLHRRNLATAPEQQVRSFQEIPGPRAIPILGNKFRFLPGFRKYDFSDLIGAHKQLYEDYGPIVKFDGLEPNRDLIFIFDPKDIEAMFRSDSAWPFRPPLKSLDYYRKHTRKEFFKGVGGVLVDQGKEWQEARHHVNPILMQTKIVQMYTSKIDKVAEEFIEKFPGWIDSKNELPDDFKNDMHKWALESIALIALDARLGCLDENLDPNSEPQRMINSVHTLLEVLHNLEIGGEAFIWRFYPSKSWRKLVKVLDFFVEVSYKYVQQAIERSKHRAEGTEPSALERLIKRDPNPTRAVVMALDMLMAGIDTTSHSLTNAMLHLSANQEKQEILHQELKRLMPDPSKPITTEVQNEMKYLRACIKESMRMMPVVTGNIRTTEKEVVLSNYKIPAGVDVLMGNAMISRFEEHFTDADKFIPERWIRGGEQEQKSHPFVTLPFGHGARKCIGMRFAMLELELMLAKMMRRYRWEFKHGPMHYKSTLVHTPIDPLKFTIHSR